MTKNFEPKVVAPEIWKARNREPTKKNSVSVWIQGLKKDLASYMSNHHKIILLFLQYHWYRYLSLTSFCEKIL